MSSENLEVDGELAARAEELATARGENLRDVIERLLEEYLREDR